MLTLALFAAAIASHAPDLHRTQIEHRGTTVQVRYDARVTTHLQQVGMAAGPRGGNERCAWTAQVAVERHISRAGHDALLSKTLAPTRTLAGSRHGRCEAQKAAIAEEVASRRDAMVEHVAQAAERDHSTLRAELDAARTLAMN